MTLTPIQREAHRERCRAYRRNMSPEQREAKRVTDAKSREKCRAHRIAHGREYWKENREALLLKKKIYGAKNKEKISAKDALYRKMNLARIKNREADYRVTHRVERALIFAAWRQAHPEATSAIDRNRKARKRNAEGTHTAADMKRIRLLQGNRCAYCREALGHQGHLDHIIALANGGSNWPRNLQWLCASCNLRKKARDPIEFAQASGMLL